jgi:putative ABC transport system permease protein
MAAQRLALLRIALRNVRHEPSRSALVTGAMAIGVAAMACTLALGRGAEAAMAREQTGLDRITIAAGQVRGLPGRGGWLRSTRLKYEDGVSLAARVAGIREVIAIIEAPRLVASGGRTTRASVRGVEEGYLQLHDFTLARGRPIDRFDQAVKARVAVLGADVSAALGGAASLLEKTIEIAGVPFEVIGELERKGLGIDSATEDNQILVPLAAAARRLVNVDYLTALEIRAADPTALPALASAARDVLRESHAIARDCADDFDILLPVRADRADRDRSILLAGFVRLLSIAGLSVAAVAVLIVSYLNVADRIWEVGLRLAIGARQRDIAALFLTEAVALSVGGGIVGAALAILGTTAARWATDWSLALDPASLIVPFAVSAAIGILFGTGPAVHASRIAPVEALAIG